MSIQVRPIFFDLEVNKWRPGDIPSISEIAAIDPTRAAASSKFSEMIAQENEAAPFANEVMDRQMVAQPPLQKRAFKEVWIDFKKWVLDSLPKDCRVVLIGHNIYEWDKKVLKSACDRIKEKIPVDWKLFDTLWLAKSLVPSKSVALQGLREFYKIPHNEAHRALADAETLYEVFKKMVGRADFELIYSKMFEKDHPIKAVASAIKVHKAIVPIFFDTETTGLLKQKKEDTGENPHIVELCAYTPSRKGAKARFSALVNPGIPISEESFQVHHISNEDVAKAPSFKQVWKDFRRWCADNKEPDATVVLIAHNCYYFDRKMLEIECDRIGKKVPKYWRFFDTLFLSRSLHSGPAFKQFSHKLQNLREHYKLPANQAHRAGDDVDVMFMVFEKMLGDAPRKQVMQAMLDSHPIKSVVEIVKNGRANLLPQTSTNFKSNDASSPTEKKRDRDEDGSQIDLKESLGTNALTSKKRKIIEEDDDGELEFDNVPAASPSTTPLNRLKKKGGSD